MTSFSVAAFRATHPQPSRNEISARLRVAEGKEGLAWGMTAALKRMVDLGTKLGTPFAPEEIARATGYNVETVRQYLAGNTYDATKHHPETDDTYDQEQEAWELALAEAVAQHYAPSVCKNAHNVRTFRDAVSELHSCIGDDCCRDYWQHWSDTAGTVAELLFYFRQCYDQEDGQAC